ncbi:hypothetical protein MES5069_440094 [Mesorhizobium escarrei]|uniref:Uncharacterized protein n=1 Tax=Mesorhizobium escarrei TaxID=666018 RepID=A0ABM9E6H2_9HYPH|nr:hypothetical protein MES5069_440094 [Mesorhizobium escarrei]
MGEGKAPVGNRHPNRLVAEIEPGQRLAAAEPRRQLLDGDDAQRLSLDYTPQTTLWDFNFTAGVLSFGEGKIEEGIHETDLVRTFRISRRNHRGENPHRSLPDRQSIVDGRLGRAGGRGHACAVDARPQRPHQRCA